MSDQSISNVDTKLFSQKLELRIVNYEDITASGAKGQDQKGAKA